MKRTSALQGGSLPDGSLSTSPSTVRVRVVAGLVVVVVAAGRCRRRYRWSMASRLANGLAKWRLGWLLDWLSGVSGALRRLFYQNQLLIANALNRIRIFGLCRFTTLCTPTVQPVEKLITVRLTKQFTPFIPVGSDFSSFSNRFAQPPTCPPPSPHFFFIKIFKLHENPEKK